MAVRIAIREFGVIQKPLAGATVTFFEADENGESTGIKATLYQVSDTASAQLRDNPQILNSDGMLDVECYTLVPLMAQITNISERTARSVSRVTQDPLDYLLPITTAAVLINDAHITNGTIDGTPIGQVDPRNGKFLDLRWNTGGFSSDRRLKDNIRPLKKQIGQFMALQPVSFTRNAGPKRTELGFIAQDVETVFPEMVGADDGNLTLYGLDMLALLTSVVQEQQRTLNRLRLLVVGIMIFLMAFFVVSAHAEPGHMDFVSISATSIGPSGTLTISDSSAGLLNFRRVSATTVSGTQAGLTQISATMVDVSSTFRLTGLSTNRWLFTTTSGQVTTNSGLIISTGGSTNNQVGINVTNFSPNVNFEVMGNISLSMVGISGNANVSGSVNAVGLLNAAGVNSVGMVSASGFYTTGTSINGGVSSTGAISATSLYSSGLLVAQGISTTGGMISGTTFYSSGLASFATLATGGLNVTGNSTMAAVSVTNLTASGQISGTHVGPGALYASCTVRGISPSIIIGGQNCASVTRISVGLLGISFTSPAPDASYTAVATAMRAGGTSATVATLDDSISPTTTGFVLRTVDQSGTLVDSPRVSAMVTK